MAHKNCMNICNVKIETLDCNPGNRELWYKNKLPTDLDPVRSNIINGCWECNYDESNEVNTTLCNRNFYDGVQQNPCNMVKDVDVNSKLKNLGIPYNKYCKLN